MLHYDLVPKTLHHGQKVKFYPNGHTLTVVGLGSLTYDDDFYSSEDPIPDHVINIVKDITAPIIANSNKPLIDLSHLITLSEVDF